MKTKKIHLPISDFQTIYGKLDSVSYIFLGVFLLNMNIGGEMFI